MSMSNRIIFDIPSDGIRENDIIFLELTENCDIETATHLYEAFQHTYPKAEIALLHPSILKSVRFFHREKENYYPELPF